MKKLVYIIIAASITFSFSSFKLIEENTLDLKVTAKVQDDDKSTTMVDESQYDMVEFTCDCTDCGKIYIFIEGKYAGAIDVVFRNKTSLMKKPGKYKYTAKSEKGEKTAEGEIVCPGK